MARGNPSAAALGGEGFDLGTFLPFRISALANRLARRLARISGARFQLTAPEWRIIAVLGQFGAMQNHRVIEITCLDPVRMSRAVSGLLHKGYITRGETPEDRRRAMVELTEAGRGVFDAIVPLAIEAEESALAAASKADRENLERILTKLEQATQDSGGEDEAG
jgi:DNA-binding MarR family transcriptional regulator